MQREDRKTVSLTLCNDWVEDNFTPECLSVVQHIASQSKEYHRDAKDKRKLHSGFLSVDKENGDMEPVSWEGIHDLHVNAMRYLPPKKNQVNRR